MEFFFRLFVLLGRILGWILSPFFWCLSLGKVKKAPAITNNILFLSATKLAEKIRSRELKSEKVVKAYIERIKEVNPIINAIVEDRFLEAVLEAQQIDRYLDQCPHIDIEYLQITQPLLGVPMTVKESCAVKGLSHTVGSCLRPGIKAQDDGGSIKLLRQAGAIPLLVSNTPEYCLYWECNNLVTGRTNNPYNHKRSSAGSSGGEGALLGAGASVVGIGSDVAGSIRMPGMFNGVFGHKGTTGIVPIDGHFPAADVEKSQACCSIGPLVRYAEDLPLMMSVITGEKGPELKLFDKVDMKTLNIFHMDQAENSIVFTKVQPEIKLAIAKAVNHLRDNCGSTVSDYKFNLNNSTEMCVSLLYELNVPFLMRDPLSGKHKDNIVLESIKSIFSASKYSQNGLFISILNSINGFIPRSRNEFYYNELGKLEDTFWKTLGQNGIFIFPTFPTTAFKHGQYFFMSSEAITYLSIFNLLGLPCTNVPMGLDKNGLPIGIQIVAGRNNDRLCFAVAKELERAFGGWVAPSST